jgi:hypothetical protein
LWDEINPDLEELDRIIFDHFKSSHRSKEPLNHGAYARVFHYTLENGFQLVARVILPARETTKTEAEVSAMEMVRGAHSFTFSTAFLIIDVPQHERQFLSPRFTSTAARQIIR